MWWIQRQETETVEMEEELIVNEEEVWSEEEVSIETSVVEAAVGPLTKESVEKCENEEVRRVMEDVLGWSYPLVSPLPVFDEWKDGWLGEYKIPKRKKGKENREVFDVDEPKKTKKSKIVKSTVKIVKGERPVTTTATVSDGVKKISSKVVVKRTGQQRRQESRREED